MTPISATTRGYGDLAGRSPAAAANRRRRLVFGGVLLLAGIASLAYVFMQPAEYRAVARWEFVFAEPEQPATGARSEQPNPAFLTELQVVTSRPLLEKLGAELRARGLALPAAAGDSVDALQRALSARPVAGTTVVELVAQGPQADPLAPAINALFDIYRRQLDETYRSRSGDAHLQARDEAAALQAQVDERRRALNAFRARHDIVSLEREENQVLSQVKGQGSSLNVANDKVVAADAKLRSLRDSIAAGKSVARARDNPTLANLEQRLSQAREEMRALERSFTEAYLQMDPGARALRARTASLEEQLKQARDAAQQAALAEAEEELAAARLAAGNVMRKMSDARQSVQTFTARMAEFKAMQEELDRLEQQRGAAMARATTLETGSRRVAPTVRVLEAAATPAAPGRPDYTRDAAIALAGSLLLALLAVGLVEIMTRPEVAPATLVVSEGWGAIAAAPAVRPLAVADASRPPGGWQAPTALLQAPTALPELDDAEITALLAAAAPPARAWLLALLSGLTAEELAALNWSDVDLAAPALRLPDRSVVLVDALAALLARQVRSETALDAPVFANADGRRPVAADIEAAVAFAAHDAGLACAGEVNAAALRHTCVAHLVRQGARFGDLSRWVGRLPADALGVYGALAPPGPKRPAEEIDPVLPSLRRLAVQAS
jgi:succinoglycan biosynthesis transport protein ExoP